MSESRPARPKRLTIGAILLLLVLGNGLQLSLNVGDLEAAIRGCVGSAADLIASGILLILGLWLVWTGLPRD